jgi:hypothetical protein
VTGRYDPKVRTAGDEWAGWVLKCYREPVDEFDDLDETGERA